jgi:hypothetical protein
MPNPSLEFPALAFNPLKYKTSAITRSHFLAIVTRLTLYYLSEGFSALGRKCRDMSSEGCAAHPVGYNNPLQINMVIWRSFFKCNLLGWVLEPAANKIGCLVASSFKKSGQTAITIRWHISLQGQEGPKDSKGSLRPNMRANN